MNDLSKLFVAVDNLEEFNKIRIPYSAANNQYVLGGQGPTSGTPDFKWSQIVFIFQEGIIWARGKFFGTLDEVTASIDGLASIIDELKTSVGTSISTICDTLIEMDARITAIDARIDGLLSDKIYVQTSTLYIDNSKQTSPVTTPES